MTHTYHTANNHLVVKQVSNEQTLNNGLKVEEARGKKDYVKAQVVIPSGSKKIVYFPQYAALPIRLENETYLVIDKADVHLYEEDI